MSLFPTPLPRDPALPEPSTERWQVLRAGLQNLWEYDDQRFVFHRGRLLLRGRNESGKTKALELLFPFLLDADLSPQRLDPFGSTSRPMRWNLINDQNPDVQVAIGYAWLELGRVAAAGPETCTIGAGLRAKRANPNVDAWYFVTAQRVDRDLRLLDGGRVPLTRVKLEEAIGGAGRLFETRSEYRLHLNRLLFDMPDEQYAALVEALLQLRRPQLSKQLEPEQLSRILTASLPPLEARAVAPLAEGFERLDRHRAEREELAAATQALRAFTGVYRGYVAAVARARALELTRADSAHQRARAERRRTQEEEDAARAHLGALDSAIERLAGEEEALAERVQALRSSEEYRALEQLDRAEAEARERERRAARAAELRAVDEEQAAARARQLAQAEEDLARQEEQLVRLRRLTEAAAVGADLADADAAIAAQLAAGDLQAARGTLDSVLARRAEALRALAGLRAELARLAEAARVAEERRRDAQEQVRELEDLLAGAERARAEADARFDQDVASWIDGLRVMALEPPERAALLETPPDLRAERVDARMAAVAARLDTAAAERAAELRTLASEADAVRSERDALAAATHAPPPRPAWRPERATGRAGAPFYLLCEFREGDPALQATVEAALESAGLLDAWVLPEGVLLERDTLDVVLRPAPRSGRTLADVLAPTAAGGVSDDTIERVLRTVALLGDGQDGTAAEAWISTDGRWGLGPLEGRGSKTRAAFIGATARERERQTRLAELDAR